MTVPFWPSSSEFDLDSQTISSVEEVSIEWLNKNRGKSVSSKEIMKSTRTPASIIATIY